MTEISVEPLGHYILVEALKVEDTSASGIYLGDKTREQSACEFGIVRAFGPTCFIGIDGCDPERYPPGDPRYNMAPHELWGLNVGDQVEYRRYEGKYTGIKEAGALRYIPDAQIIGKVKGSLKLTKADF
jgi:co-chaperonin GroES (HSP10)